MACKVCLVQLDLLVTKVLLATMVTMESLVNKEPEDLLVWMVLWVHLA